MTPSAARYAIQLLASDPLDPLRLAGRLEHVLSGRCHDFANGPALLACLAFEQQQARFDAGQRGANVPPGVDEAEPPRQAADSGTI